MNKHDYEILPVELLDEYLKKIDKRLSEKFASLTDSELSADTFSFYTSVSVVFSSKIEGESIELDSFIKHKKLDVKFLPDYTRKIDDLYDAYQFAQGASLNPNNLTRTHQLLTKNILHKSQQGEIRSSNMFVTTVNGKIEYVACSPVQVSRELERLYHDIDLLLDKQLSLAESFFFSSMIHLVFVKIHPYNDGNGRTARLLEKWFLAQTAGPKAWFVQSEKYYYDHHEQYYANIRKLGLEYDLLDYAKALPFLLMLPNSLK